MISNNVLNNFLEQVEENIKDSGFIRSYKDYVNYDSKNFILEFSYLVSMSPVTYIKKRRTTKIAEEYVITKNTQKLCSDFGFNSIKELNDFFFKYTGIELSEFDMNIQKSILLEKLQLDQKKELDYAMKSEVSDLHNLYMKERKKAKGLDKLNYPLIKMKEHYFKRNSSVYEKVLDEIIRNFVIGKNRRLVSAQYTYINEDYQCTFEYIIIKKWLPSMNKTSSISVKEIDECALGKKVEESLLTLKGIFLNLHVSIITVEESGSQYMSNISVFNSAIIPEAEQFVSFESSGISSDALDSVVVI